MTARAQFEYKLKHQVLCRPVDVCRPSQARPVKQQALLVLDNRKKQVKSDSMKLPKIAQTFSTAEALTMHCEAQMLCCTIEQEFATGRW